MMLHDFPIIWEEMQTFLELWLITERSNGSNKGLWRPKLCWWGDVNRWDSICCTSTFRFISKVGKPVTQLAGGVSGDHRKFMLYPRPFSKSTRSVCAFSHNFTDRSSQNVPNGFSSRFYSSLRKQARPQALILSRSKRRSQSEEIWLEAGTSRSLSTSLPGNSLQRTSCEELCRTKCKLTLASRCIKIQWGHLDYFEMFWIRMC